MLCVLTQEFIRPILPHYSPLRYYSPAAASWLRPHSVLCPTTTHPRWRRQGCLSRSRFIDGRAPCFLFLAGGLVSGRGHATSSAGASR